MVSHMDYGKDNNAKVDKKTAHQTKHPFAAFGQFGPKFEKKQRKAKS